MEKFYLCQIDKYISDDTEQVYGESIDMTYLRKIYMNIAPIGHNFYFQNSRTFHKVSY